MDSSQIRQAYLDFFSAKGGSASGGKSEGHAIIPSASLIPENDPSVLFTNSGMHPLVPYLLGEKHPAGTRLANAQKCVRTGDIEEVGDIHHLTFFEMLGNWSLGDYWKKEVIEWTFEWFTSPQYIGIPVEKFHVTVFSGDNRVGPDEESLKVWGALGVPDKQIHRYDEKENFWQLPSGTGPCGPCTEMFFETDIPCKHGAANCRGPACDCEHFVEVGNNVFMEFTKSADGSLTPLKQRNVDTGCGLERMVIYKQGVKSVYETDLFTPLMSVIDAQAKTRDEKARRVVAEHLRAATFILGDEKGIVPSNLDQGYILRRLIRRAIRNARILQIADVPRLLTDLATAVVEKYSEIYPELSKNREQIFSELVKEEQKFSRALDQGLREFQKIIKKSESASRISGEDVFQLVATYGFPYEMVEEEARRAGKTINKSGYQQLYQEHQALSRTASAGKFKGGMGGHSEIETKYHTATHLLHAALRKVLGPGVEQRGSNINQERLRFDFSYPEKLTDAQKTEAMKLVNDAIARDIPVEMSEMSVDEAKKSGAIGLFADKYGDKVKVYAIGDFSKEICGGPHVKSTGSLGHFEIKKEEASSAGVRRIKAVLM